MKTFEEIKDRIEELKDKDIFGFETGDLLEFLPFEYAKEFLKPDCTEEEWSKLVKELTDENVKAEMIDYMEFAWEKANNCRGLSASRSMSHYSAWVWLLGSEAVNHFGDFQDYEYYGKDNLVALCNYLGLDSKKWDDGIRSNSEY